MESLRAIELKIHQQEKLYYHRDEYMDHKCVLSRPLGYSMKKLYEGQCGMRSKKEVRKFGCGKLKVQFNILEIMDDIAHYPATHLEYMEFKYFDELYISHSDRYRAPNSPKVHTKSSIPRRGIINICRVARFIRRRPSIGVPCLSAKDINALLHAFHHIGEIWLSVTTVPGATTDFRVNPSVEFKIGRILQDGMEDKDHWLAAIIQSPSIRKNLREFGGYFHGKNEKLEKILSEWDSNIGIEIR
ncbi:unnamed protein product [Moneuplotes crassus]|uniref:Uncharacterized protein n=1 Tax=Euplotes crassus TaxID=5936 RepID=A0AAD1XGR6_EUPCR|nr:unnamed protein product [Moneuplotes crassus]